MEIWDEIGAEFNQEIERLRESVRLEHEMPPDFFMG